MQSGEANQVAALLRFFAFLVEPDADLGTARDLLAHGVNVLIPGDLLAWQNQLAGVWTVQVVALADGPLHQLRTAVDEIVGRTAIGAASGRGAGVDGVRIVIEHEVGDRVMNDPAALESRWTNLHHARPARLGERDVRHRPIPDVLMARRHRVFRRSDDEIRRTVSVSDTLPLVVGHERPGRRHVLRIALRRAGVHPADDRVDLLVGERDVVLEFLHAHAAVDVPRRHLARFDAVLDRPRPGPRLFVGDERHRRDRVRLMARLTLRLENRRDVFRERDRCSRVRVGGANSRRHRKRGAERHQTGERHPHNLLLHAGVCSVRLSLTAA